LPVDLAWVTERVTIPVTPSLFLKSYCPVARTAEQSRNLVQNYQNSQPSLQSKPVTVSECETLTFTTWICCAQHYLLHKHLSLGRRTWRSVARITYSSCL